jgi:hypothetical protein
LRLGITSQGCGSNSHRNPPTRLPGDNHRPGSPTLLRSPSATRQRLGEIASRRKQPPRCHSWAWREHGGHWNINQLCIDYASRPRLSSRLTLGGLAFPRNPWAYGGGVSHPSLATHACILTRWRSTPAHAEASPHHRRSSTAPTRTWKPIASAQDLSPVTLSAQDHSTSELLRTLSRVAASKPTSWLSVQSHIVFHLVLN